MNYGLQKGWDNVIQREEMGKGHTVTGTPLFEPEQLPKIIEIARNCENKDSIITHEPRLEESEAKAALSDYANGKAGKLAFDLT